MKIGLYLQDKNTDKRKFDKDMNVVKKSNIDLFVLPEDCYTPFASEAAKRDLIEDNDLDWLKNKCIDLSNEIGCALIYSGIDKYDALYSLYINPFEPKAENEMTYQLYVKHTATYSSSFDFYGYSDEWINGIFEPIVLNGTRIGLTICYDCNHAAFSRMWGKNGIDILINSTGGNVDYYKWYRYNKARAIENKCINLCTMGYESGCKNTSHTFGFTPNGKQMKCQKITDDIKNSPVGIYVYNTDIIELGEEADKRLDQNHTKNKYQHYYIKPYEIKDIFNKSHKIDDGLYMKNKSDFTLVYIEVWEDDIVKPENVLKLLYHPLLKKYKDKRYIIINRWNKLNKTYFENVLSDIIRVRTMENYCVVLLDSPDIKLCYQTSKNRVSQMIAMEEDGSFGIDLDRAKGPEVVWKNESPIWREGYEKLIDRLNNIRS